MATVWITSLLRDLTGGRDRVEVSAATVGELVEGLENRFPGMRDRLCKNGRLDGSITAVVDGIAAQLGLAAPVRPDAEVHFLPVIGGG